MDSLSSEDLNRAIVETLPAFWRTYADRNPSAVRLTFDGAEGVSFGLPHPLFNLILRSEQITDVQASTICNAMDARGLPWMWCGHPTSSLTGLPGQLARLNFGAFTMPAMALDISESMPAMPSVPGLEILEAKDMTGIEAFARAILPAYEMPPNFSEFFTEAHKAGEFFPDFPGRIFYGVHEGRPVTGSMVFFDKEVAAIQCVGTHPDARSRGFASAIVSTCLQATKEQGYRYAVLHASEMGFPVYVKLGFTTCFHQNFFIRS